MTPPPANPTQSPGPVDPVDRRALLIGLAAGHPQAYAELYEQVGPALFRVARTVLGCRADAEDAVQDVMVSLVRSRHRLPFVEDLDAYLFGMLRHVIGRRRAREQAERQKIDELAMIRSEFEEPVVESDDRLQKAVARLPAQQREIVALKISSGLSFAQIAQILGINPNTAASRYRYALLELRGTLETW